MPKQFFCRTGSKLKIVNRILQNTPPHSVYVEPFVGGGSLYWSKEPAEKAVINDLSKELIEGYTLLKSMKKKQPNDFPIETNVKDIQAFVNKPNPTKEERLLQILYTTCNTFGSSGKGKIYKESSQKKKIDEIEKYVDRMKNTTVLKQDYKKVIHKYDSSNTFFFLDPPYENSDSLYKDDTIDYEEMADVLNKIKGKFLLTINDSPNIRKIFKDFVIKPILVKGYGYEGIGKKDRKELFIMNYKL